MAVWSTQMVMRFWIRNGGNPAHVVNACAVALAESGNNDHAISSANDWGLFQINASNFDSQGVDRVSITNPDVNTKVAIRMSGNGTNWAAWCSCWARPVGNCGHGFLSDPEPGSPAYNKLGAVEEALSGLVDANQAPPPVTDDSQLGSAWQYVQDFVGPYARDRHGALASLNNAIRRL